MVNSTQILGFLIISGIFESGDSEKSFSGEAGNGKADLPQGDTASEDYFSEFGEPYKFTGKELDEETGWYYYGHRTFDPKLSRWISADPPMSTREYLPVPPENDEAK